MVVLPNLKDVLNKEINCGNMFVFKILGLISKVLNIFPILS